jgi:hypothetical protein
MFRRLALGCFAAMLLVPLASAATAQGFIFNAHWGGAGVIAGRHTEDLCTHQLVGGGGSRRVGVDVDLHATHVVPEPAPRGVDRRVLEGYLYCSPELEIWPHTSGPWDPNAPGGPGWLSITCFHLSPIDGGAGFHMSSGGAISQVAGGFGHGRNGYWHYRFHNPTDHTVNIQFWAVCVDRAVRAG